MSFIDHYLKSLKNVIGHPLASDAGLLTASQYIAAGIGFLTTMCAARMLGPDNYGIVALVTSYPTLLWSFVSFKPLTVTTRYIASFRAKGQGEDLSSICKLGYTLDLLSSIAVLVLISLSSWWVARYVYNVPNVAWLIVIYGASFPFFSLAGTSRAILTSWQDFRWLSIFQILERSIQFILVLGFLSSGLGVTGMIIAIAIGHAFFGIIITIYSTSLLNRQGFGFWWNASLKRVRPLLNELGAFFGWNYVVVTLGGLITQGPIMLLGYFHSPEEAGFYRIATNITTIGSYFEASLRRVVYPILSTRWETEERHTLKNTFKQWTSHAGIPLGIFLLVVILLLPFLVPMMFGSRYNPMISGLQVMMVGAAVSVVFFWLDSYYYASGKIGMWTKSYGIYTAFSIFFAWFFVQQWGFLGMATIVTAGKILFILVMLKLALKNKGNEK